MKAEPSVLSNRARTGFCSGAGPPSAGIRRSLHSQGNITAAVGAERVVFGSSMSPASPAIRPFSATSNACAEPRRPSTSRRQDGPVAAAATAVQHSALWQSGFGGCSFRLAAAVTDCCWGRWCECRTRRCSAPSAQSCPLLARCSHPRRHCTPQSQCMSSSNSCGPQESLLCGHPLTSHFLGRHVNGCEPWRHGQLVVNVQEGRFLFRHRWLCACC